jgi:tripartite-type tricarboxylate transporter receptor subunit TctC
MKKIIFVVLILTVGFYLFAQGQSETKYPTKAIELVVPANAGGGTDINARVLGTELQKVIGQSVAIINIAGGAGTIASAEVLDAPSDGYKALYFHADLIINTLTGMAGYDWKEEFKIAGIVSRSFDYAVIVRGNAPFNNVKELKEYVAKTGVKPKYAMETGGIAHILALAFQEESKIDFNLVDIGGAANKISNLLGGHVDLITMPYGNVRDYVANGDFKVIGVMGGERSPFAPDIPTFKEQGYNIEHETFFFIAFNKKTPDNVVQYMSDALKKATATEEFKKGTENLKYSVSYMDASTALEYMKHKEAGYKKYTDLALAALK